VADGKTYEAKGQLLTKNVVVIVSGKVAFDDYSGKLTVRASDIQSVDQRRMKVASQLTILVTAEMVKNGVIDKLEEALSGPFAGDLPVSIMYHGSAAATFRCGERWSVSPTDELLRSLRECVGESGVVLGY